MAFLFFLSMWLYYWMFTLKQYFEFMIRCTAPIHGPHLWHAVPPFHSHKRALLLIYSNYFHTIWSHVMQSDEFSLLFSSPLFSSPLFSSLLITLFPSHSYDVIQSDEFSLLWMVTNLRPNSNIPSDQINGQDVRTHSVLECNTEKLCTIRDTFFIPIFIF